MLQLAVIWVFGLPAPQLGRDHTVLVNWPGRSFWRLPNSCRGKANALGKVGGKRVKVCSWLDAL